MLLFGGVLLFSACTNEFDAYKYYDSHYPASAVSPTAISGKNRLQLQWEVSDPGISGAIVYWHEFADSSTLSIDTGSDKRVVKTLINLPEGEYNFTIYNLYSNGLRSTPSQISGVSLGESYSSSLKNRSVTGALLLSNGSAKIFWGEPLDKMISTVVTYWDIENQHKTAEIGAGDSEMILPDYKADSGFVYSSRYGNELDTFACVQAEFKASDFGSEEVTLDKSKFKKVFLAGDGQDGTDGYTELKWAWDGKWSTNFDDPYGGNGNGWHNALIRNASSEGFPISITIDLGQTAKLTRLRLNHYYPFIQYDMKKYEIWGAETIDGSGDWKNWTKLASVNSLSPTSESFASGDTAEIDPELGNSVRYIRIRCLENWGSYARSSGFSFAEITLWGYLQ